MDEVQVRKQAEALVAQMTVEEAASQLKYDAPAIERLAPRLQLVERSAARGCRAGTATVFPRPFPWPPCLTRKASSRWRR